ncbi:hypothetical protein [Massilia sp. BJB1822]|uniref:hypothetical protein n=1 Tax=Massilia sp. BJB1822 TaxID=2744470 RepID=UPI0015939E85|nr:hypothetical protein [Massilia sp. BJB1822]NVD97525.1 hypothetical protein [Massilia sp. BJB1822]
MSTINREEFDARLETIEVRMDGRVAAIQGQIAQLIARLDADKELHASRLQQIETSMRETANSLAGLKSIFVITAVSTVTAIVLGVAAFNATLLSNMVASFESGKSTAAAQAELRRQGQETAALLNRLQESMTKAERDRASATESRQTRQ